MKATFAKKLLAVAVLATAGAAAQAEVTANAGIANNYIWRGLTQTENEAVISGGIDYSSESGFYAGTWAANVNYGGGDAFSYEHDLYFGFAGEAGELSYDVGYLYYNYDDSAGFDFSEVYFSLGFQGASVTAYILADAEPTEAAFPGEGGGDADFGFGSAYYLSFDYGLDLGDGWSAGLHYGIHDGDFVNAFNFQNGTFEYADYAVSFSKDAFSFTISDTDLKDTTTLNNGDFKYTVGYTFEI